jgi:tripartite-type tricarboxylate transporter receptor subunit TctC
VPKNTPAEIIDRLNVEINAALADPKISPRLVELGTTPLLFSPAEFRTFVEAETEKSAKVIAFSGAREN